MEAVSAAGALAALAVGPALLALPGVLLLLALAPSWGWTARAVVGFAVGAALLSLLAWAAHAGLGAAFDARLVWSLYGAILALCALVALVGRRAWWPLRAPKVGREHAILLGIVALAVTLVYRPRWGDPMPIHVDEWWHLAASMAMERQGIIEFIDPRLALGPLQQNPWVGFHLFAFVWKVLSGAGWMELFHVGPAALVIALVLAAWCSARPQGYAAEAALLVAIIPTSLRLLGPQFFVPVTLGLFLIPVAFLLFTTLTLRTLPLLVLVTVFMVLTHPQSGAALGMLIGTYALWSARRSLWKSGLLALVAAVPFVLVIFLFPEHADFERALDAAPTRLAVPEFLLFFGIVPATLFLAGTYLTLVAPTAERLAWVTTSFLHLLLVGLYLVANIGQANLYDRAWMHAILTMSMTGGYALWRARERLARWTMPRPARAAILAVATSAIVLLAATAQAQRESDYYRVITADEHRDFAWIRDHVPANGSRALIDPWQGAAFATVTGIPVFAYFPDVHGQVNASKGVYQNYFRAIQLLENGSANDVFLQRANVTLIYTSLPVQNENFTQLYPRVWVRTNGTIGVR